MMNAKNVKHKVYVGNNWVLMLVAIILQDIIYEIFIGLIALAIILGIVWFFREKVIHLGRFFSYRIFNTNARIKGIHIRKYFRSPKSWLSCKIFDELRGQIKTDTITKKKVSNENMIIKSKKLGTAISICIDPEIDPSTIDSNEPKIIGHKVTIELEDEIRLGLRDVDDLDAFLAITEYGQEIIQKRCFSNNRFYENYMVIDLIKKDRFWTKGKTKLNDSNNKAEISITNSNVEICLSEPKHLLKVIRKYFII